MDHALAAAHAHAEPCTRGCCNAGAIAESLSAAASA
jgi:hypothetical protein